MFLMICPPKVIERPSDCDATQATFIECFGEFRQKMLLKNVCYFIVIFKDQTVRYNALIAVQKMMVNNWEILGRQIAAN